MIILNTHFKISETLNFMARIKEYWMVGAKKYIGNSAKMLGLIACLRPYLHKNGLKLVKNDLKLLMSYVADVAKGRYRAYHISRLLVVLAALIYVLDPADIIPDFFFMGFVDDVTVIGWAISKVARELQEYKAYISKIEEQ